MNVGSEDEESAISTCVAPGASKTFWIGLKYDNADRQFKWSDNGATLNSSSFHRLTFFTSALAILFNYFCVEISFESPEPKWVNGRCSHQRAYVCERGKLNSTWTTGMQVAGCGRKYCTLTTNHLGNKIEQLLYIPQLLYSLFLMRLSVSSLVIDQRGILIAFLRKLSDVCSKKRRTAIPR